MTPEQKSRQNIDRQLAQSGWIVQDHREMNISAGLGVAVREFPLATGHADYMLYADGKAIGVVEAKPEGYGLLGVAEQSAKYRSGLHQHLPAWRMPLPFAFERSLHDPTSDARRVAFDVAADNGTELVLLRPNNKMPMVPGKIVRWVSASITPLEPAHDAPVANAALRHGPYRPLGCRGRRACGPHSAGSGRADALALSPPTDRSRL